MNIKSALVLLEALGSAIMALAEMQVTDVKIASRYPWNGKVDISYNLPSYGVLTLGGLCTDVTWAEKDLIEKPVTSQIMTSSRCLYVDAAKGDDANAGTDEAHPFKSIQRAIDLSQTDDLILVNDGVYDPIVSSNKSVPSTETATRRRRRPTRSRSPSPWGSDETENRCSMKQSSLYELGHACFHR